MPSYSEASKRLVCLAPLDTALTLQLLLEILMYLRVPEYLLHYACPGIYLYICVSVCVCVCTIKALKRVLLTSIEYKFSLYRLSFYFFVCWCAPGRGTTVHFVMTEEATSLLRSRCMQWKGLFCAPSFLTFRPLVFCG